VGFGPHHPDQQQGNREKHAFADGASHNQQGQIAIMLQYIGVNQNWENPDNRYLQRTIENCENGETEDCREYSSTKAKAGEQTLEKGCY